MTMNQNALYQLKLSTIPISHLKWSQLKLQGRLTNLKASPHARNESNITFPLSYTRNAVSYIRIPLLA
jgi:hypothetical protein